MIIFNISQQKQDTTPKLEEAFGYHDCIFTQQSILVYWVYMVELILIYNLRSFLWQKDSKKLVFKERSNPPSLGKSKKR
jgi:hypothetical protein